MLLKLKNQVVIKVLQMTRIDSIVNVLVSAIPQPKIALCSHAREASIIHNIMLIKILHKISMSCMLFIIYWIRQLIIKVRKPYKFTIILCCIC